MTRPLALVLLACAAASTAACSPKRIPGSEISDTPETRAVLQVVEGYRQAMERRDAGAVLALVAPDYFDGAGTPEPADDLDRARLEVTLPQDLARMEGLRLDLSVRRVDVAGDVARAEVVYDAYYRVVTPAGQVPRRDSDVHQLQLRRLQGGWRITAGL